MNAELEMKQLAKIRGNMYSKRQKEEDEQRVQGVRGETRKSERNITRWWERSKQLLTTQLFACSDVRTTTANSAQQQYLNKNGTQYDERACKKTAITTYRTIVTTENATERDSQQQPITAQNTGT